MRLPRTVWITVATIIGSAAVIGGISVAARIVIRSLFAPHARDTARSAHVQIAFDISPAGDMVVFSGADGDLYALNHETQRILTLTDSSEIESTPRFHPEGGGIIFARETAEHSGSSIFTSSMDRKEVRQLTHGANVYDSSPAYSADGSMIVFARALRNRPYSLGGSTWDKWDLYSMKSDGSDLQRITREEYFTLESPNFSIDGTQVIFSATPMGSGAQLSTIFEVDAHGRAAPTVPANDQPTPGRCASWASEPRLSPDGSRIVFVSDRKSPYRYVIFTAGRDGSNPIAIGVAPTVSRYNQSPVFTPDGQGILFLASRTFGVGNRPVLSLWRVEANGANPLCLATSHLLQTGRLATDKPSAE
jgi:Tol biopolymer transport system component